MVMRWKTGKSVISVRYLKAVLGFIGYDPRSEGRTWGERVKRKREGLGLSERKLAKKLGVDSTSVWKVEANRGVGKRLRTVIK